MKKISTLLALVSLSLTAAAAAHAAGTSDEVIVFATHQVRASRHNDAEKKVEQHLADLRAQAAQVAAVRVELPLFNPLARQERVEEPARHVATQQGASDDARS